MPFVLQSLEFVSSLMAFRDRAIIYIRATHSKIVQINNFGSTSPKILSWREINIYHTIDEQVH